MSSGDWLSASFCQTLFFGIQVEDVDQPADNQRITQEEATVRPFELHVYTLRTKEVLNFYREVIYPRHLDSFSESD